MKRDSVQTLRVGALRVRIYISNRKRRFIIYYFSSDLLELCGIPSPREPITRAPHGGRVRLVVRQV